MYFSPILFISTKINHTKNLDNQFLNIELLYKSEFRYVIWCDDSVMSLEIMNHANIMTTKYFDAKY